MANISKDRLQMAANTEVRLLSVGKSKDTFKILFVKTTEDLKIGSLKVELSKDEAQTIITALSDLIKTSEQFGNNAALSVDNLEINVR